MPGQRWMILAVLFAARAATGFQFQSVGSTATMLMPDLAIMQLRLTVHEISEEELSEFSKFLSAGLASHSEHQD